MAEQLSLVGIDKLGNVRANVSSLTVDVPGCAWFRDCRTGVWGRLSGEHGVGWRTGREVGAARTVMVDKTVVGTEGRLLMALGVGRRWEEWSTWDANFQSCKAIQKKTSN